MKEIKKRIVKLLFVFERMMKAGVYNMKLRLAEKTDFEFFYELKSEDFNVFWTGGGATKPEEDTLRRWFEYAIDNQSEPQSRKIYIVEDDEGKSVGHMYIIPNGEEYDLPVAIRSEFGGKGYAKAAISMGLKEGKRLGFKKMVGSIREDNIASMKAYISCGVKVLEEYRLVYIPKLNREVKMFIVEYVY